MQARRDTIKDGHSRVSSRQHSGRFASTTRPGSSRRAKRKTSSGLACLSEREPSEEHVFPAAIGGTLVIDRVCKPCNDRLGANVDVLTLVLTFPRPAKYRFGLVAEISITSATTAPSRGVRHTHVVVQFRAVGTLDIPRPRTRHGGGLRFSQKICRGPLIKRQKAMRCDSVAMRAVSSRRQLKSLRDERWREPLEPSEGKQKNGPAEIVVVDGPGSLRRNPHDERLTRIGQKR
jgi:hypothetical protein